MLDTHSANGFMSVSVQPGKLFLGSSGGKGQRSTWINLALRQTEISLLPTGLEWSEPLESSSGEE